MLPLQWQLSCSVVFTYGSPCLAVVSGEQSRLLANVHIALLRLLQMDLEDAHATGAIQASLLVLSLCLGSWKVFYSSCTPCSCLSADCAHKFTFSMLNLYG